MSSTESPNAGRRRRSRIALAASAIVLALVVGGVIAAVSRSTGGVASPLVDRTNRPAASFSLPDLRSPTRSLTLSDFRGKDLVVNFWASWCYPCRTEMPLLESAYRTAHGRVQFIGIDSGDQRGAAVDFSEKEHVSYPLAFDPKEQMASSYGIFGLPITVFVSRQGRVLGRLIGQLKASTLRAALKEAFGPSTPG